MILQLDYLNIYSVPEIGENITLQSWRDLKKSVGTLWIDAIARKAFRIDVYFMISSVLRRSVHRVLPFSIVF